MLRLRHFRDPRPVAIFNPQNPSVWCSHLTVQQAMFNCQKLKYPILTILIMTISCLLEWERVCVCVHVCVYTVITNGFSSFHCSCTILKSRGQRYPCHFLCQRSWVTCGKDIDQGRLIYVPAIVSTVDFLFLFMSCALFLRS